MDPLGEGVEVVDSPSNQKVMHLLVSKILLSGFDADLNDDEDEMQIKLERKLATQLSEVFEDLRTLMKCETGEKLRKCVCSNNELNLVSRKVLVEYPRVLF